MTRQAVSAIAVVAFVICTSAAALAKAPASDDATPDADGTPASGRSGDDHPCGEAALEARHAPGIESLCPPGGSSAGIALADFNDDGFGDLAIGSPFEDVIVTDGSSVANAGQVLVIYGSEQGLDPTAGPGRPAAKVFSQTSSGVPGTSDIGDNFGFALAAGDFDRNGAADLAIGVPGEDTDAADDEDSDANPRTGTVTVIYGKAGIGLTATDPDVPAPVVLFLPGEGLGAIVQGAEFGRALAWGDFNGDDIGDLAAAAPFAPVEVFIDLVPDGAVAVFYGQGGAFGFGLRQAFSEVWTRETPGIQGEAEDGRLRTAEFGKTLTSGDFDGNGFSDLVMGAPGQDIGSKADAGAVHVIYGSGDGLTAAGNDFWHQDVSNVVDGTAEKDLFGTTVAAGDFDDDGRDDLAIGVVGEDVNNSAGTVIRNPGAVHVLYGTNGGLGADRNKLLHENTLFSNGAETDDFFGQALASADFDGDGADDLAVGTPFENVGSVADAGRVVVVYGIAGTGLTKAGVQSFDQGKIFLSDETFDRFGAALSAWNFGRGAQADLAIATIGEDLVDLESTANPRPTIDNAGAITVLYGTASGIGTAGAQLWSEALPEVPGRAETDDNFGFALY